MVVSMMTICVTIELPLHAAFAADEVWVDILEPARIAV